MRYQNVDNKIPRTFVPIMSRYNNQIWNEDPSNKCGLSFFEVFIWDVPNARRSYRNVEYIGVTLEQITSLIDQSSGCRQYVRLDCHHSKIWEYPSGKQITFWVSRNGSQMVNWGVVDTGVKGCACYANRSYLLSLYMCYGIIFGSFIH